MNKVHYISPSVLPSKAANSVHVMMQCAAFAAEGVSVTLYAKRSVESVEDFELELKDKYGSSLSQSNSSIVTYYSKSNKFNTLKIAFLALRNSFSSLFTEPVITRNFYMGLFFSVFRKNKFIYETHQLELGLKKPLQKFILRSKKTVTVVISEKLKSILADYHNLKEFNCQVLHDSAPSGITPAEPQEKERVLSTLGVSSTGWEGICGYFGHLYPGRGIEIISEMAKLSPRTLFLVFGGNPEDVEHQKKRIKGIKNIEFRGFVSHPDAKKYMRAMDVLLMPYQRSVSIGVDSHDTARWMSPMKMFEYMATGVPIISSNLPVLGEVLTHGQNALLVEPADPHQWAEALAKLIKDPVFAADIGAKAHEDYRSNYTWEKRARLLFSLAN